MKGRDLNTLGSSSSSFLGAIKQRIFYITIIIISIVLGGFYLLFAWNRYENIASTKAIQLAQSVEALLHIEHIMELPTDVTDQKSYIGDMVTRSLKQLVDTTDAIYHAFILKEGNGDIIILADSDDPNPLGEDHYGTKGANRVSVQPDNLPIKEPIIARYESWVRALVPIENPKTGEKVATLGLSYSAREWQLGLWKQMIPDFIIVISILLLVLSLLNLRRKNIILKEESEKLILQEILYRSVFEQVPVGITLVNNKEDGTGAKFQSINPMGKSILGGGTQELKSISWPELTHPEDLKSELPLFRRFIKGAIDTYNIEKRLLRPDGSFIWVNAKVSNFVHGPFRESMYLCLLEDISNRKSMEDALKESERSKTVFLSHLPGMAYRCKNDEHWTMEFVSEGCSALTGYAPESLLDNREIAYRDIIPPEYLKSIKGEWERVLAQKKSYHDEYEIITKDGKRKWVLEQGQGSYDAHGNVEALEGIILDISEQKKRENQITYLSQRDFLTGLYNRVHLDEEIARLDKLIFCPLSLIICDIDGLGVINDAYGRGEGDQLIIQVGKLIQSCSRRGDILGRINGGEFMLLMPRTHEEEASRLAEEIQNTIDSYNRMQKNSLYEISLSIGYGTKEMENQEIDDIVKVTGENLRRRKLLNQKSSHHAIVSSILATLYAKSQETEEHGKRLGELCNMVGKHLNLEQNILDDLSLLSMLHDIGKIGVDDQILNKPGKLTEEEWAEMKKHPEIGHRIAMSTPNLEHIAKFILHHHERWDGKGYPMGLKGRETPLVSRILAVADAYDAMIGNRVYKKAMPWELALKEIEANAGTQFDPDIARLFVELIYREKREERHI